MKELGVMNTTTIISDKFVDLFYGLSLLENVPRTKANNVI